MSVVIALGSAGRAVLPTIRSVAASREIDRLEIIVACAGSQESTLREMLSASSLEASIAPSGDSIAQQRRDGVGAASSELIAILAAGDVVSDLWLSAAERTLARKSDGREVARPEHAVTFGARSGWWSQPGDEGRIVLPIAAAWCAAFAARASDLAQNPQPDADDSVVDAAWQALLVGAGLSQTLVEGTVVFQRVWAAAAPWEPHATLLPHLSFLGDSTYAASLPEFPPTPTATQSLRRRLLAGRLGRVARVGSGIVRPWSTGLRRVRGTSLQGLPAWVWSAWLGANRLEPLITFPRPAIARWYESAGASVAESRFLARAYWWFVDRMGGPLDYLYFAPWVRTGGGDAVLRHYIESVGALDPAARVGLITTEPEDSPMLGRVSDAVAVAEARDLLDAGVARDDLVQRIVPTLITQLAPHTVHAFNSTVAFDIVERFGEQLAHEINLFLTTFAIDRSADGERLSVLFLRRPGFLDPVKAVFVDSAGFIDRVVGELGYARDKFVVQRSVVDYAAPTSRELGSAPLRVFWAGRFDLPKRLDVLARIATGARSAAIPVEFHFYGLEVMGTPGLDETLRSLEAAGAVRHPPYSKFVELPLADFDAYVLTSEWEGIPLTVLEAMAAGIPVVAPLVGSVGEVLDDSTGFPVRQFDDAEQYLAAFAAILAAPAEATQRAETARSRVRSVFSPEAFNSVLARTDGYLREN